MRIDPMRTSPMEQPHARTRETALSIGVARLIHSPCISDRPCSGRSITAAIAGPIRKGAVMQVKPNSIWFDESAQLTHWQELKKSGNAAALTSYEEQMLGQRDAWQFLKPLKVKILRYEPATSQVNVEMKTAGRLQGTTWWLDASAVGR